MSPLQQSILIMTFVLLGTSWASSSPQLGDPHVIIHDPPGVYTDVGSSFSFMSDEFGGGAFLFTNDSGITWSTLSIFVPPPSGDGEISCASSQFTNCTVEPGQGGFFATLFFSGGPGIPNGESFSIDLGPSGWTPDATFQAYANPEPGTLWLFLIGLGPLLARRRRH